MKKLFLFLCTAAVSVSTSFGAYAGAWVQNETGWWYDYEDDTYAKDGWHWIDDRCYYFTNDGYCLINTTTPDGYTVDESGAWTENGAVQSQSQAAGAPRHTVGSLAVNEPQNFRVYQEKENSTYFVSADGAKLISVMSESLLEGEEAALLGESLYEMILDAGINASFGEPGEKVSSSLAGGQWYRYRYENVAQFNGPAVVYGRIINGQMQMIMFAGQISGLDTDAVMNEMIGQ